MNIFNQEEDEDVVEAITRSLEEGTKKKIFTFKVLDRMDDNLESIVVFEDKSVLLANISVYTIDGNLACRMQGNYI